MNRSDLWCAGLFARCFIRNERSRLEKVTAGRPVLPIRDQLPAQVPLTR